MSQVVLELVLNLWTSEWTLFKSMINKPSINTVPMGGKFRESSYLSSLCIFHHMFSEWFDPIASDLLSQDKFTFLPSFITTRKMTIISTTITLDEQQTNCFNSKLRSKININYCALNKSNAILNIYITCPEKCNWENYNIVRLPISKREVDWFPLNSFVSSF